MKKQLPVLACPECGCKAITVKRVENREWYRFRCSNPTCYFYGNNHYLSIEALVRRGKTI